MTRIRWSPAHALGGGAGSVVVLAAMGLGAGPIHGLHSGNLMTAVPRQAAAALMLPASVWLLAGIGLGLVGLLTQATVHHLGCGRLRAAVNSLRNASSEGHGGMGPTLACYGVVQASGDLAMTTFLYSGSRSCRHGLANNDSSATNHDK